MNPVRPGPLRLAPSKTMGLLCSALCAVVLLTACATPTEPLIHRVTVEVTREAPVDSARAVATGAETPGQAPVEVVREVPVEVTRIVPREVEVTRIAPKEVVREVIREVLVTPTPMARPTRRPTATPPPTRTPTPAPPATPPPTRTPIPLPFVTPGPGGLSVEDLIAAGEITGWIARTNGNDVETISVSSAPLWRRAPEYDTHGEREF